MADKEKPIAIPPYVRTIADLIQWLADTQHGGSKSELSRKVGASIATASFWARGDVLPNLHFLQRISDRHHLSFDAVMKLWRDSRDQRQ